MYKRQAITSVTDNPYIIALLIDLIILVLGCIMDMAPIILIATPILLPIATSIEMCIRDRLWRIRSNMDGLQNVSDEQWVLYGACLLYTSRCV